MQDAAVAAAIKLPARWQVPPAHRSEADGAAGITLGGTVRRRESKVGPMCGPAPADTVARVRHDEPEALARSRSYRVGCVLISPWPSKR